MSLIGAMYRMIPPNRYTVEEQRRRLRAYLHRLMADRGAVEVLDAIRKAPDSPAKDNLIVAAEAVAAQRERVT